MITDKIRGCLIAGAAGDALGYEVEFMCRRAILSRFGEEGIRKFALDDKGKALISDDTQMTLFTASGLLSAEAQGKEPIYAITRAYIDWYYTQTPKLRKKTICKISAIPELNRLRAPGNTCLSALESIARGKEPLNNSKGCGGIMRVAPIALFAAKREEYNDSAVARLAAEASEVTHQHPLGFLPSALFSLLIYKLLPLTPAQAECEIGNIVAESFAVLDNIYPNRYEAEKEYLKEITQKAIELAHSTTPDADAILQLGEGWVAEETWAIALYCAIRHIGSVEEAIAASVNHDGDSDSTGSVCGNIMGAIYGYGHIKERNIFCPDGKELEETLELSGTILAIADEIATN